MLNHGDDSKQHNTLRMRSAVYYMLLCATTRFITLLLG
ncbi:hypothetical protein APHDU1_0079 [Anaplasma phagocytophilum]|nr:hypothetical protein APHDU1_0079 [Anaplasma phagocytophilum]